MSNAAFWQKPTIWVATGLLCSFLWASAPAAIKIAYVHMQIRSNDIASMLLFAGIRFTIAGLITFLFTTMRLKTPLALQRAQWLPVFLLGLLQTTIHYAFYFVGAAKTSGAHISIIVSMQTFIIVIVAHFLNRSERLNRGKIIAIALGSAGIILLNSGGNSGDGATFLGDTLIFFATLFGVAATLYARILVQRIAPFVLTGWQLFLGGLTLIGIGMLRSGKIVWNIPGVLLILYLAFLSSIAFSLWNTLILHHPVSRVTIFTALIPVFGTLLSGVLLGEAILRPHILIAMVLVSIGVYLLGAAQKGREQSE